MMEGGHPECVLMIQVWRIRHEGKEHGRFDFDVERCTYGWSLAKVVRFVDAEEICVQQYARLGRCISPASHRGFECTLGDFFSAVRNQYLKNSSSAEPSCVV